MKRGKLIKGFCQDLLRNDVMDIWFAVVSLQRSDLCVQFNSFIYPLSGIPVKQFCHIISLLLCFSVSDPPQLAKYGS